MSSSPLEGVRILDLTSVVVGPVATWRLGQYGAEIIKLESPSGDLMRSLGGQSPTGQHSGAYLHFNRGKQNICLDLKHPAAREVIDRLVETADVVVSNMRPQALERLGLDEASIRAKHPDKICCLITGYGTDGPYAGRPTYDSVLQGASGMAGLMLARDGTPTYVPMVICDHVVGEIVAGAVLAAIVQKHISGNGSSIEIPMFETMAAFVLQEHLASASFNPPLGSPGDKRLLSPHNAPVQTSDGWISFTINTENQVRAFLEAVGRSDLLEDPRFANVQARMKHVDEWYELRNASLTGKTTQEWLDIFLKADIPALPCHSLESLSLDPHLEAVGLVRFEDHPTEGEVANIRSSVRTNGQSAPARPPAQPRGWATCSVLEQLGYGANQIGSLLDSGAVFAVDRND